MDIYGVVTTGVDTKGMPAWGKQLSPAELRQVVAYVGSIRNTNRPGKAPEGKLTSE
jgi:cytochrome c oxidase cbb3-type subunit 3